MTRVISSFKGEWWFLSNFSPVEVAYPYGNEQTMTFASVEHGYQAAKTIDLRQRRWVQEAPTAREAKQRGRQVTLRHSWERGTREWVMEQLLRQKFSKEPFRHLLLETHDAEIIEGNDWHDDVWGDCVCPKHADTPGANRLGVLLMKLREELKAGKDLL